MNIPYIVQLENSNILQHTFSDKYLSEFYPNSYVLFILFVPARNIYIFNDEKTSLPFLQYKLFPNIQFEY
jgi:hypothetical protein